MSLATAITLRPAELGDCDLLFGWVNNPDSLANKLRTSGPIAHADHAAWFAQALSDPDCFLWIIVAGGHAVGQIRLAPGAGGHEVDIYVEPGQRRRGIALSALTLAAQIFARDRGRGSLIARVLSTNSASRLLFQRAGFRLVDQVSDHEIFELPNTCEPAMEEEQ